MDTPTRKRNCKDTLEEVCADWDGWLLGDLWDSRGWLAVTHSRIGAAFPTHAFPRVPPAPAPLTGMAQNNGALRSALKNSIGVLLGWAQGMSLVVHTIHQELIAAGHPQSQQLESSLKELLHQLNRMRTIPNPGSSNATGMCGPFTGWARRFRAWGYQLHVWENLGAGPSASAVRQVPPPPWPPWKPYSDQLPDSDGVNPEFLSEEEERGETF